MKGIRLICVPTEVLDVLRLVPAPYGLELQLPADHVVDARQLPYSADDAAVFDIAQLKWLNDQRIASIRVARVDDVFSCYSVYPLCRSMRAGLEAINAIFEQYAASLLVRII